MQFVPCVRWSGGKRKQSEDIINSMPHKIGTLFVPFLGGASVPYQFVNSNIKYNKIVASDIYKPLIDIWLNIQSDYRSLISEYTKHYDNTMELGESYYYKIRSEFNSEPDNNKRDHNLFHYLTRACMRGSIEFDKAGNFSTNFMVSNTKDQKIISPSNLLAIVERWSECFANIEFRCESYEDTIKDAVVGDYVFFDPPYIDGDWYYDNNLDMDKFYDELRNLKCDYSITLNGDREIYPIPKDCYTDHKYIYYGTKKSKSGLSVGSRDSYWMKKTSDYEYDNKINIRQNSATTGGRIPQINDIKLIGDINGRIDQMELTMKGMNSKFDQLLEVLQIQKGK